MLSKGGYSLFEPNTPALQVELYLNDGKRETSKCQRSLPVCPRAANRIVRPTPVTDGDGWRCELVSSAEEVPVNIRSLTSYLP